MRNVIVSACFVAVVSVLFASTMACVSGCISCKTDQDCGSAGLCVNGTCQSPAPGH